MLAERLLQTELRADGGGTSKPPANGEKRPGRRQGHRERRVGHNIGLFVTLQPRLPDHP